MGHNASEVDICQTQKGGQGTIHPDKASDQNIKSIQQRGAEKSLTEILKQRSSNNVSANRK